MFTHESFIESLDDLSSQLVADTWTKSTCGKFWIRNHVKPRTLKFKPCDTKGQALLNGPDPLHLKRKRHTYVLASNNNNYEYSKDTWTLKNSTKPDKPQFEDLTKWTGKTYFAIKKKFRNIDDNDEKLLGIRCNG